MVCVRLSSATAAANPTGCPSQRSTSQVSRQPASSPETCQATAFMRRPGDLTNRRIDSSRNAVNPICAPPGATSANRREASLSKRTMMLRLPISAARAPSTGSPSANPSHKPAGAGSRVRLATHMTPMAANSDWLTTVSMVSTITLAAAVPPGVPRRISRRTPMNSPPMPATGSRRLIASRTAAIASSTRNLAVPSTSTRQPQTSRSSGRKCRGTRRSNNHPAAASSRSRFWPPERATSMISTPSPHRNASRAAIFMRESAPSQHAPA